tara:strand:+ start:855 stop:1070 length:216 start_codon:yes stop_codon:yes gene_type:complete
VVRKLLKKDTIADKYIPESSYDLIDYLSELYPQRCILENETPEQAHRYAGACQLVSDLVQWKQNETESEGT